jgi:hypothetical protein
VLDPIKAQAEHLESRMAEFGWAGKKVFGILCFAFCEASQTPIAYTKYVHLN